MDPPVRVTADIGVTLDGFGAGPRQCLERPFGDLDQAPLHAWMFDRADESPEEIAGILEAKAYVMGRNMFSPDRGPWDLSWRGWWGEEPPYRAPVFVLTHHPRPPLEMTGGTTFHFVTDGLDSALQQARAAAGDGTVAIAGGATTINAALAAGVIDELRLHVAPYSSGLAVGAVPHGGSRLFDDVPVLGLVPVSARSTPHVTHLTYRRP
ncbi:dihydrofolate reductase family protein [Nocardioides sp. zg-536]|uniref:Dihydrofolate reductase family protein n=1 Tax=Nocardioides faecalis TaxID=2803858 RepID=A0A938Y0Q4_9ACTN|nr:dihydrofolate reductase family protein [Nocardioides faecalis]MBM9460022.1 dihydrofolate reductase family protein [Nocardioides faecalis]QVI58757.1 dihydrofolate reductase family protein [Nocardioides faecalis]